MADLSRLSPFSENIHYVNRLLREKKMTETQKQSINEWGKEALLALPVRAWDQESAYDSVLLLSTGEAHDSGWATIAIIGVAYGQPVEIAVSCCDDIEWKLPAPMSFAGHTLGQFRMDCALASGALHAWQRCAKFKVGTALSSTTIEMVGAE